MQKYTSFYEKMYIQINIIKITKIIIKRGINTLRYNKNNHKTYIRLYRIIKILYIQKFNKIKNTISQHIHNFITKNNIFYNKILLKTYKIKV